MDSVTVQEYFGRALQPVTQQIAAHLSEAVTRQFQPVFQQLILAVEALAASAIRDAFKDLDTGGIAAIRPADFKPWDLIDHSKVGPGRPLGSNSAWKSHYIHRCLEAKDQGVIDDAIADEFRISVRTLYMHVGRWEDETGNKRRKRPQDTRKRAY